MLKQRVITAAILLAVVLATLLHPAPWPFLALALALVCAAAWEWGRLNGLGSGPALALAAAMALAGGLAWALGWPDGVPRLLWLAAGAAWCVVIVLMLRGGVAGWRKVPQSVRLLGGLAALWLAWLAISQARVLGVGLLLSVCVLVWTADIAAYFSGRALGQRFFQRKLAPALSPGKSWEGALGGMAMVLVVGWGWSAAAAGTDAAAPASLFGLLRGQGVLVFVLGLAFLTLVSIAGDLIESLVKRSAGAKDSSQLLPGHGGVLDRIDALIPTFPVAMMLVAILG